MCSLFPCGVKTTHSAIFSTFLFIFSATDIQSFLSVQLETKLFLFFHFFSFHEFKPNTYVQSYWLSETDFGTERWTRKQFLLSITVQGRVPNVTLLPSVTFFFDQAKKTSRHSFCVRPQLATHITQRVTKGLSVFVAFCRIFVPYSFLTTFVSILFLSFSAVVFSAKVQKCVISQHQFFLV